MINKLVSLQEKVKIIQNNRIIFFSQVLRIQSPYFIETN